MFISNITVLLGLYRVLIVVAEVPGLTTPEEIPESYQEVITFFKQREDPTGAKILMMWPILDQPEMYVFSVDAQQWPRTILFMTVANSDQVCEYLYQRVKYRGHPIGQWIVSYNAKLEPGGQKDGFSCSCQLDREKAPYRLKMKSFDLEWQALQESVLLHEVHHPAAIRPFSWHAKCPTGQHAHIIDGKAHCGAAVVEEECLSTAIVVARPATLPRQKSISRALQTAKKTLRRSTSMSCLDLTLCTGQTSMTLSPERASTSRSNRFG